MTSGHPSSGRVAVAEVAYEAYDGDYGTDEPGDEGYDDYDDEGYEAPRPEERSGQGRLKVVDDRFADLPPPPGEHSGWFTRGRSSPYIRSTQ